MQLASLMRRARTLLTAAMVALVLSLSPVACSTQPYPVDGGVQSTPSTSTRVLDTIQRVVDQARWVLPTIAGVVAFLPINSELKAQILAALRAARSATGESLQAAVNVYRTRRADPGRSPESLSSAACTVGDALNAAQVALLGVADALRRSGYQLPLEFDELVVMAGGALDETPLNCMDGGALAAGIGEGRRDALRAAFRATPGLRPFPMGARTETWPADLDAGAH